MKANFIQQQIAFWQARKQACIQAAMPWWRQMRSLGEEFTLAQGDFVESQAHLDLLPFTCRFLGRSRFKKDAFIFLEHVGNADHALQGSSASISMPHFFAKRLLAMRQIPQIGEIQLIDHFGYWSKPPPQLTLSPFVYALLPVQDSMDKQLLHIRSKGHRRKIAAALKKGFDWKKSRLDADFEHFYDTMYTPFAQQRFGEDAMVVNKQQMQQKFRQHGFLLLYKQNDVVQSGAFMYTTATQPDVLHYWKYAIGDHENRSAAEFGDISAITEAMVLRYAIENNYKMIDFGLTKPCLNNGIFVHKKRLGCQFEFTAVAPRFFLMITPSDAHTIFLKNPMLLQRQDACVVCLGLNTEQPESIENVLDLLGSLNFSGLAWAEIYIKTNHINTETTQNDQRALTQRLQSACPIDVRVVLV